MFKKNLDTIKNTNPTLAEKLEKIDINSIEGIDVFEAESGDLIITYKNIPLHSSIDPVREAKTVWNRTVQTELKKNDIQIVFGLGLGYLFKRAFVSADSKVFVYEPYIEVLRFVLEHVDFSAEINESRVYITDNILDIYSKLQNEFLTGDRVEFLFLNDFAQAHQTLLTDVTTKAFEIIQGKGSDENTIFKLNKLWLLNFFANAFGFDKARLINTLENSFEGKTALIASAGPSLADDIATIKQNREKLVIFSVGRAFKPLVNAGIIPDFTVFADVAFCSNQVEGAEEFLSQTNVILLHKSDKRAFANFNSKSKFLYLTATDALSKYLLGSFSSKYDTYRSGGSVSIISYYAAKLMGFGKIIFSGLDLAFVQDKIYADGQKISDNSSDSKIVYVKDREENKLPTRADYAWFVRQFSEIFTEEVNLSQVINCSMRGAFIDGMDYMTIQQACASLTEAKPDIDAIVENAYQNGEKDWKQILSEFYERCTASKDEFYGVYLECSQIYEKLCGILREIEETGKTDCSSEDFQALNNSIVEVRQKIMSNTVLSMALQEEMWIYSKRYRVSQVPSREDVLSNLELDRYFYEKAKEKTHFCTSIAVGLVHRIPKSAVIS